MCAHSYYVASPHYSSLRKTILLWCVTGIPTSSSNFFVFLYFRLQLFQALHYYCHFSGRLLLWSSSCVFRAWDLYCSVEVATQISSSETLNKPHNSPYACLSLIIFALHGSIEIVLNNSLYFMWTSIMCPAMCSLCLYHISIKKQVLEILVIRKMVENTYVVFLEILLFSW